MSAPRIEQFVRMFHAGCGGMVSGEFTDLRCSECGQQMTSFVTSLQETQLKDAARALHAPQIGRGRPPLPRTSHEGGGESD